MTVRKAIFITGGGSGIGRAVAQKFAANGWFVGLADISESGMKETAALLPAGASSQHKLDAVTARPGTQRWKPLPRRRAGRSTWSSTMPVFRWAAR